MEGVGLVVDTSATMGPLCSSMLSCMDKGNNKEIIFGLVGLASLATVLINVNPGRLCAVAVKGMVRNIISRVALVFHCLLEQVRSWLC